MVLQSTDGAYATSRETCGKVTALYLIKLTGSKFTCEASLSSTYLSSYRSAIAQDR